MKLITKEETNEFQPFELTLRIESLKEAALLYHMFNYAPYTSVLAPGGECQEIRDYIATYLGYTPNIEEAGYTYKSFYSQRSTPEEI